MMKCYSTHVMTSIKQFIAPFLLHANQLLRNYLNSFLECSRYNSFVKRQAKLVVAEEGR